MLPLSPRVQTTTALKKIAYADTGAAQFLLNVVKDRRFAVTSQILHHRAVTAFEPEQHAFRGFALTGRERDIRRGVALLYTVEFKNLHIVPKESKTFPAS